MSSDLICSELTLILTDTDAGVGEHSPVVSGPHLGPRSDNDCSSSARLEPVQALYVPSEAATSPRCSFPADRLEGTLAELAVARATVNEAVRCFQAINDVTKLTIKTTSTEEFFRLSRDVIIERLGTVADLQRQVDALALVIANLASKKVVDNAVITDDSGFITPLSPTSPPQLIDALPPVDAIMPPFLVEEAISIEDSSPVRRPSHRRASISYVPEDAATVDRSSSSLAPKPKSKRSFMRRFVGLFVCGAH